MKNDKDPEQFSTSTKIIGTAVAVGIALVFLAVVIRAIRWILGF